MSPNALTSKFALVSLIGLVTACTHDQRAVSDASNASASAAATDSKKPVALAELRARETDGLGEMPVVAGDGTWRGALLSKSKPTVERQSRDIYQVKSDIGAQSQMQCTVFSTDLSGGVWLSAVLDGARKSVQMLNVEPKGIEVIGNHVGMDVIGTYTADTKNGKAIGEIKIFILSGSDRGFECFHDELGYSKTFGASARSLAKSFELLHEPWQIEGIEISRAEIDEHPVGFNQHYWVRMPNGVQLTMSRSLITHQSAPGELATEDEIIIEGLGPDNRVVSAQYQSWTGATEAYKIKLEHVEKGRFKYEGTSHGKALSGELLTKDKKAMESSVMLEERISEALKKKQKSKIKWEEYLPESDPTHFQTIDATVFPKERRLEARKDKAVAYQWLDDHGTTERMMMNLGRAKLNIVRLVRKGH